MCQKVEYVNGVKSKMVEPKKLEEVSLKVTYLLCIMSNSLTVLSSIVMN